MKFTTAVVLAMLLVPLANAGVFRFAYAHEELVAPDELFDRLESSVDEYCKRTFDMRSLGIRQFCRQNLVQITVEEIGHPKLTAYADIRESGRNS